jgi:methionyl-tRNA formyltransferase
LKIVFMGTPEFAVPSLSAVAAAGHDVVLVVTQPDRPKGRGKKLAPPAVKECAEKLGLPVFQPEKVRTPEAVERIAQAGPDAIVVAAFGQILPKSILSIPKYGCFNVHASLLPAYRGAAPINWAIINGEKMSGITIMQMDEGLDTGAMLIKKPEQVRPADTAATLTARLAALGSQLILAALKDAEAGRLNPQPQDNAKSSYAPMLKKETGRIDWGRSALELERLVRGLDPWPGAFAVREGQTLKIWGAKAIAGTPPGRPGMVADVAKDGVYIETGDGLLAITEVQSEGGRRMPFIQFLSGHRFQKGERFGN